MSSAITFKYNNQLYTFDDIANNGLYRQNAMTIYEEVFRGIILAREVPADPNIMNTQKLFYLVSTEERGWLQVDITIGENLLNILNNKMDID